MTSLPLHSNTPQAYRSEKEKEPWATPKSKFSPSRKTVPWRYAIVVGFLVCYYLLLRPAEAPCTSPKCLESCDIDSCTATNHHGDTSDPLRMNQNMDEDVLVAEAELQNPRQRPLSTITEDVEAKIPLEAHIMSKCPDAKDCLQKLILPAMEQISDKVDFNLSFIAR